MTAGSRKYRFGDHMSIHLETESPPYIMHGTFMWSDDEDICICGTVGDNIGHNLVIPKRRILYINWQKKADR